MPNLFIDVLQSKILLSCMIAWVLAQGIKTTISLVLQRRFSLSKALVGLGGMPSSHSAFVTALALSVYVVEGMSTAFIVAFAFAAVTLRDAAGIRLAAGSQAKVLNEIIFKDKLNFNPLPESIGHRPIEVFAGVGVGLVSVVLVSGLF